MENYLKRFFIGHLLILVIVVCAIRFLEGTGLIAALIFAGLLESLFYYLDTKYLPRRRTEIKNELIDTFRAESISEGILRFKIDTIDFFVKVEIDIKQTLQLANMETIRFYIPITQIDKLSVKPGSELKEDKIGGVHIYEIYQENSSGLSFAKEVLKNMIKG